MANRANKNRLSRQGFTLVEMAIVLVIVGLLVGMGASMVGPLMIATKVRETRDNLDANSQAISSWASANNRLPDTTSIPATNSVLFANVAKTPNDSWGRSFIYLYDSALAPGTATKDTICGRRSTVISLTDSNNPGTTISNVAYLVISQADDAKTDTKIGGATVLLGQQITTTTTIAADTVNDIVRWVTLDELRSKVGCQGAPLKIVNNELPYGSASSSTYSAMIIADGGVPSSAPDSYSWCIQTSALNTAPAALIFQKPDASGTSIPILSFSNLYQTNCSNYAAASWPKAGKLLLSGTPNPPGSYFINVYVSDTNSNIASKPFVLTINP